ncbi:diguanylate cyclase [Sphingomonas sp. Leaf198]|uniref:diguanylate cyclase n=1 Tax=Sphingomonas sp. Leaf198 TaxID=1736299 RepID=UPI0009E82F89|nr:diguanylate cyclase [Sphingomonas sp. Leaf198]
MPVIKYDRAQGINDYVDMLSAIYGPTQNYNKSTADIFQHMSEVCGVAGKHLFKKRDMEAASRFVPKIFGWACALISSVDPRNTTLADMILRKYPQACPYCLKSPCSCWIGEKPDLNDELLGKLYYRRAGTQGKSINELELMFSSIYGHSWSGPDGLSDPLVYIYLRLTEELAEVSEALRFRHLYPRNFENEIADFLGWWFALAIELRKRRGGESPLTDELLWSAYPGHCRDCESTPCFCQQGPVRELMSKPAPGAIGETDSITTLRNQGAYQEDLRGLASGALTVAKPIACIRIDIDKFKTVNDSYGHSAGDAALKHIATILRLKARPRDRIYRISGDEFGILMPDCTEEEAYGSMRRVSDALKDSEVTWTSSGGDKVNFFVSVSVGVAECQTEAQVAAAFEAADKASYLSKAAGRAQVTRATSMPRASDVASNEQPCAAS